jgi:Domain of unknown function (DUF4178)
MSTVASCPGCGAEVRFRWAGAVQTVCEHCGGILVRRDVDLERVGRVSEPPPRTSRIRVGSTGAYEGRRFEVVGRIAYAWESGAWSEWHLAFADGRSGWLSDAQDEYAVTFVVPPTQPLPAAGSLRPGEEVALGIPGGPYAVGVVTRARYAGLEGELPFEYHGRDETPFVDLRSRTGRLATIDYSDDPPLLFAGEFVDFAALGMKQLLDAPERRVEGTRTLRCPGCGGSVTLRRPGESVTAVCEYCLRVLSVGESDQLRVVQEHDRLVAVKPLIPLGQKGRLAGAEWTVLGMQQRTITVEGERYSWREYLLHAPERGFRYLTEYDGHWNDVTVLKHPPTARATTRMPVTMHGESFRPFQHAKAKTTFVLGEFPWQVRVGDTAQTDDYVSPPRLLSREQTPDEVSWSLGEYTPPARVWEAFGLPGAPPVPRGTYANQPSPYAGHGRLWTMFIVFAVLLVGALILRAGTSGGTVLRQTDLAWDSTAGEQNVVVTEPFRLEGRRAPVRVRLSASVNNSWAAFEMTLVDEATGRTREFTREMGYYHGYEGGERWSEGSRRGTATLAAVPAGSYRLVIAPTGSAPFTYDVEVTRGGPSILLYFLAFLALLVPPAIRGIQHLSFEHNRWMESDYPPVTSGDDDE